MARRGRFRGKVGGQVGAVARWRTPLPVFVYVQVGTNGEEELKDLEVQMPAEQLVLTGKFGDLRVGRTQFLVFTLVVVEETDDLKAGTRRLPAVASLKLGRQCSDLRGVRNKRHDEAFALFINRHPAWAQITSHR